MASQENRNYSDLMYSYNPVFVANTLNKFFNQELFTEENLQDYELRVQKTNAAGNKVFRYLLKNNHTGAEYEIPILGGIRMARGIEYTNRKGKTRKINDFVYKVSGFTSLENFLMNSLLRLVSDHPVILSDLSAHYLTSDMSGMNGRWRTYFRPRYSRINIPNSRNITSRLTNARQNALIAQAKENRIRAKSFARLGTQKEQKEENIERRVHTLAYVMLPGLKQLNPDATEANAIDAAREAIESARKARENRNIANFKDRIEMLLPRGAHHPPTTPVPVNLSAHGNALNELLRTVGSRPVKKSRKGADNEE